MKKFRFWAFLCVIVMAFSMVSFASAAERPMMHLVKASSNRIGNQSNDYLLKNKETVKFFLTPYSYSSLYPYAKTDTTWSYSDIAFDCAGPVKATCKAKWVHITNVKGGFYLSFEDNEYQTNRTATVNVKAKGYSAKFVLTQFGRSFFTSVVRDGDMVNLKWKQATKVESMELYVSMYKYDDDGFYISKSEYIPIEAGKKSAKYIVEAGWNYEFSLDGSYRLNSNRTVGFWTDSVYFYVSEDDIDDTVIIR